MDYELEGESIKKIKGEKVIGNEKNKLVIQTIGLVVIEFLIKHFEDIFSYDYTKEMESELDNILQGVIEEWNEICKNCEKKIKELIKPLKDLKKETYELDENKGVNILTIWSIYKNNIGGWKCRVQECEEKYKFRFR